MHSWANGNDQDSSAAIQLDEVKVQSGFRDTQSPRTSTTAVSTISSFQLQVQRIESFKGLSGLVPNLSIPDYGSRLSSAVYIRGIGSRGSGQTIGMYMDNVPILDKSAFDLEFIDLQSIEILRGPQGTLFGRNAMGGIIHLHSISPLNYNGTKLTISGGSYGYKKFNLSQYLRPLSTLGVANQVYYTKNDGYYTNLFTQKKADDLESFGARSRWIYKPNGHSLVQYSIQGERTVQNAFPYQKYNMGKDSLEGIKMNDPSSYRRNFVLQSLYVEQKFEHYIWSSTTSHQYLNDEMLMDQDFSSASIFTLEQQQKEQAFSQEFIFKSLPGKQHQWTTGVFGFYNYMHTDAPVTFKKDGMSSILQANIDKFAPSSIPAQGGGMVPFHVRLDDSTMRIEGNYKTPNWGAAVFHQSTFQDFMLTNLSLTLGLRIDYEDVRLNHHTSSAVPFTVFINNASVGSFISPVNIEGNEHSTYLEYLPKMGLHYQICPSQSAYFSINKGQKSGGYNFQLFSDLIQERMKTSMMSVMPLSPSGNNNTLPIGERIKYSPETSWNYELGWTMSDPKNKYKLSATTFYMQIEDIQIMQFAPGGSGRMIKNAGKATSCGIELSGKTRLSESITLDLNYGFNHAIFKNYDAQIKNSNGGIDTFSYSGNAIPYAPSHTLSLGLQYIRNYRHALVDQIIMSAQYIGQGKIYWNEANSLSQNFYGILNGKISLKKDFVRLDFWIQNATNTRYNSFYFESLGNSFFQANKPIRSGIELCLTF